MSRCSAEIPEPERRSLREFWRRVGALHAGMTAPVAPGSDAWQENLRRGCNVRARFPNLHTKRLVCTQGRGAACTCSPGRQYRGAARGSVVSSAQRK